MMSMCRVLSCCWKRVLATTSAFSWPNFVSFCPASFCTPRPILPVTPGISWLSTFAFQSPMMKRTSFFGVNSRESSRPSYSHLTLASSELFVGHWIRLLWYWMVCLWDELRSFCRFWYCTQVVHFRLYCWLCQQIMKKNFHHCDKSHIIMVYESINMLLNLICYF